LYWEKPVSFLENTWYFLGKRYFSAGSVSPG